MEARRREIHAFGQAGANTVCVCVFDHCLIGLRSAPGRVNREGRNAFAPWSMSSICQGVCEGC